MTTVDDIELFFRSPQNFIAPPQRYSTLHLLRRDAAQCLGIDPNSGKPSSFQLLWPGAMTLFAGMDLLGKFYAGSDAQSGVTERFRCFVDDFFQGLQAGESEIIYQLRNSLMHSFGLFSVLRNGATYRFLLTANGGAQLVRQAPNNQLQIDLRVLYDSFERAVAEYKNKIEGDRVLVGRFEGMFQKYGSVYVG